MQLERVERLGEEVWSRWGTVGVDRSGDSTPLRCVLPDCSSVSCWPCHEHQKMTRSASVPKRRSVEAVQLQPASHTAPISHPPSSSSMLWMLRSGGSVVMHTAPVSDPVCC
jgi:hypothetical protein